MVFFGIAHVRPSCDNSTCYVADSALGQDEAIPGWPSGHNRSIYPLVISHFNPALVKKLGACAAFKLILINVFDVYPSTV